MRIEENSIRVVEQETRGMQAFPAALQLWRLFIVAVWAAAWAATWSDGVAATGEGFSKVEASSKNMTQQHAVYLCEVSYSPARSNWVRELRVDFDTEGILRIEIDRVVPYGFDVAGALLFTSIDNERIVVDLEQRTWRSDFRGLSSGRGRCDRQ